MVHYAFHSCCFSLLCIGAFDNSCRKAFEIEGNINSDNKNICSCPLTIEICVSDIIFISAYFHDLRDYTCTKHCDAVLELHAEV